MQQDRASLVLLRQPEPAPAKPHTDLATIISLIGATSTSTGLKVACDPGTNSYPKGIAVGDAEMKALNISRAEFHGEWNHTLMA